MELIVDDDKSIADDVAAVAMEARYAAVEAMRGPQALAVAWAKERALRIIVRADDVLYRDEWERSAVLVAVRTRRQVPAPVGRMDRPASWFGW